MSFTLSVSAAQPPPKSCYPPTWAQALSQIAASLQVEGLDSLSTFVFGPSTPTADQQNLPWIKTTAQFQLIGLFTFFNGSWQAAPPAILPGTILDFFGAQGSIVAPYYLCDGSTIIGATTGNSIATPNLQGVVTIGTGTNPSSGTNFANQTTGGGSTILTASMIPAHNHNIVGYNAALAFNPNGTGCMPSNAAPIADLGTNGIGAVNGGNTTGTNGTALTPNPPLPTPTIPPYYALWKIIFWP